MLRHPYFRVTAGLFVLLLVMLVMIERPVKIEKRIAERALAGKEAPTHWLVPVWLWRGLAMNVGLAGVLVLLTPLAGRKLETGMMARPQKMPFSRREWMLMVAAGALFIGSGAPRLGFSLWGDEEYTMKRVIADDVFRDDKGVLQIEPRKWMDTIWDYNKPTNHVGYTVIARLFHDALLTRKEGPQDPWFSEVAIRLPVLIAGLGSMVALVWACLVWGWRRGVAFLALGYAGHAWLVRFGVDARGYGFVLLLVPVLVGILGRALQTGGWRWWIGFGLAQFYILWTYPGVVHVPVALNVAALAMILTANCGRPEKLALLGRWLVSGVVCAMLVVGIMSPLLPGFIKFLNQKMLAGEIDAGWLWDGAAALFCGVTFSQWDPANSFCVSLSNQPTPEWVAMIFVALGLVVAVLGICAEATRKHRRWFLLFLVGGPALMILHLIAGHTRPYHWYLIPFLPCMFFLWAAAMNQEGAPWRRWTALGAVIVCMIGVHVLAFEQSKLYTRFPIEYCRESVAEMREITNPRCPGYDEAILSVGFAMYTEAYDPGLIRFSTVEELRNFMRQSDTEKRPLYLNFGFGTFQRQTVPEIMALIDNPNLFERIALMEGQFITTTREVFRYRAGSVATLPNP